MYILSFMKNQFYALLLFIFSLLPLGTYGQSLPLLPKPQSVVWGDGVFSPSEIQIKTNGNLAYFEEVLINKGFPVVEGNTPNLFIDLVSSLEDLHLNQDEAYTLKVTSSAIYIKALTERGAYWAIQTLSQLRISDKEWAIAEIVDWPAFRIRGFMQDVGRSYISMEELKKEIAKLAEYKINTFHWHLTENQAWRLESKKYPELTDAKNMTRMAGKFYTLDEAKELVQFCKEHQVMLIPEIDMPGHSAAFERTFGVDMQSEKGTRILKDILEEVCATFDVPYIHIGTDEVQFTNPEFVPNMVSFVRSKGKKVISWNPGWHYKEGEIDMTQLWSYRGKAQKGIPAIDCRFHYINHFDTFADIFSLYVSKIYDMDEGSDDLAGSILAIWNDRLLASEENIVLENHLYPSMLAFAERAWLGGGYEYFNKCGTVIPTQKEPEYLSFLDFENRMLWHKKHHFEGYPFGYVKQLNVKWNITDAFPNNGDLSMVFPPEKKIEDEYIYDERIYKVREARGASVYLRHVWGTLVPGFYSNPEPNHTAYAYTWVYSPIEQKVGLWAETQNYSRSEMDLPPKQGTWDYKGSKIWLNNEVVNPPVWSANHTTKSNEITMGNENMVNRKPIPIQLKKGWNKIFLKLPIGQFSQQETRLVKWMFSLLLVNLEGTQAIDNIYYSPNKELQH